VQHPTTSPSKSNSLMDSSVDREAGAQIRLPHRVRSRPDPAMWSDTELMSLAEAAALFWPEGGPLTTTSLRTAVRDQILDVAEVAGKILTNKTSILKMSICGPRAESESLTENDEEVELRESPVARSAANYSRLRKASSQRR
jgi:hypothetical protein